MTRSIWLVFRRRDRLGAAIDRDGLEFVMQRDLLHQGLAQIGVVIDDQDFAGSSPSI